MYSRTYGIESDGELFKMQQEAIRRAQETSKAASLPPVEKINKPLPKQTETPSGFEAFSMAGHDMAKHDMSDHDHDMTEHDVAEQAPLHKKKKRSILDDLFLRMKKDDLLLLVLLFLLISEDAEDDIILILGFLLVVGFID